MLTTYWRDKKTIIWTFATGLLWIGAGVVFYLKQGSLVVAIFWGCMALPWIVKGIFDLKTPYIELSNSELVVRRSVVSPKKTFSITNIEGLLRVERKELEILYNESGKRNRIVIMVNELNSHEITRLAQDLRNKLKEA